MGQTAKRVAIFATILVSCIPVRLVFANESGGSGDNTCGWDELDHSTLVECNSCQTGLGGGSTKLKWPDGDPVWHYQSTRAGERFTSKTLPRLDRKVDEHTKLFDINTTLSISTATLPREIDGLGGTLDLSLFEQNEGRKHPYGPILEDLFGSSESSARMSLLRVRVDADFNSNLTGWLANLNMQVRLIQPDNPTVPPIKVIVHPRRGFKQYSRLAENMPSRSKHFSHIELWGFVMDGEDLHSDFNYTRSILPEGTRLLVSVALSQAPGILETLKTNHVPLQGLLINSEASVPYDVLQHLARRNENGDFKLIVVARPRLQTKMHGDWSNAHEYAVEILNHLKHGASGFLEQQTFVDLQAERTSTNADCSLYSLLASHKVHFRGPMFYAISHFSRYLANSRRSNFELFTQPNMFAAHYAAFLSGDHIVALVLNGNEHNLLFSLTVNNWIAANTLLKPKSFNTFILKNHHFDK